MCVNYTRVQKIALLYDYSLHITKTCNFSAKLCEVYVYLVHIKICLEFQKLFVVFKYCSGLKKSQI